jgi:hypothetical protein
MSREQAFKEAVYLWEVSAHLKTNEKLAHCKSLAELDVFGIRQIAKIARIDPKTLRKRGIRSRASGGRFDPEALTALQELEKQYRLGEDLSKPLIELCVRTGCTRNAIAELIGIQAGKVYRLMEEM